MPARYAGRSRSVIGLPTSVSGVDAEQLARGAIRVKNRAAYGSARPRAACRPARRTARCGRSRAVGRSARATRAASSPRSSKRFIDAVMSTNALSRPLTGMRSACSPDASRLCRSSRSRSTSRTYGRREPAQTSAPTSSSTTSAANAMIGSARSCVMRAPSARPTARRAATAPTLDQWIPESIDRQRDPCWHVSAKPHVFPRFAARTPVLVVIAHPARSRGLR